ncbi:hypothetical protein EMIHUDRAFT_245955 [Emiliania huxleyi CCMP1516]|uniref:Glutamine amidotransferase type-2 domain-containing protein n=2 Tax=Emiliania huxleyi TaxID=2903 RepID=A0A0D3IVB1_EMIH1|nr:hypothetical protein EMIHUDRAFT_245955 [Emiliania huxleyi CCMP1516]EOD15196.1 hypothetical protein EMIHUDRAFT_245955 [Emiliania huxleyi CCMP1516]|eukprot:XP_005767625.1 hypothetical protein EMIHUDRAFT_245955 [Emiliania huxleyi CCMP1516]
MAVTDRDELWEVQCHRRRSQTGPSTARLLHAINHNGMLTDARLDAIERSNNYTRALTTALDARVRELQTALQTTNARGARVDALEIQVFNRTFPNARHGGSALGRTERLANRLANRVAALERGAMTIPVGVVVGARWTEVTDDSETESTDHE